MRRRHLRNETTTRRWPNRMSYRNAWLTLQVVVGRSDRVRNLLLKGGYLRLKFRAVLQSLTLVGTCWQLLKFFEMFSHTLSIDPFCFSVCFFIDVSSTAFCAQVPGFQAARQVKKVLRQGPPPSRCLSRAALACIL